jgi:sugar phosphate isomerase/epimerase
MFTLSAFADEISPDPQEQIDVLARCGVKHIELRSIHKTNVLDLTDLQVSELKSLLDKHGFKLSAIGSPIGKVKIDEPFEPHLQRFGRAIELCQVFGTPNIRIFSYYPPGSAHDWNGVEEKWFGEVQRRLEQQSALAARAGVRLLHENEHRIYGDSPERVERLFAAVNNDALWKVYDAANYVFCGYDPWEAWQKTKARTAHLHIKDWKSGATHGSLVGEGDGRWPEVLGELAASYDGFATLEPHLLGGGPTGGVTGPELFPKAVSALTAILDRLRAKYQ